MRISLFIISCLLLVACSSEPTKSHYYLLRSDLATDTNRAMEPSGIVLTHIVVATYIDQQGLVLETADGQINVAVHHLWAEPLRHSLKGFLANEISIKSGKDIYAERVAGVEPLVKISIDISQLHGTLDGNAVLEASWAITTSKNNKLDQTSYQFSKQQALTSDGYDALVAAEKKLLQQLAAEISQHL